MNWVIRNCPILKPLVSEDAKLARDEERPIYFMTADDAGKRSVDSDREKASPLIVPAISYSASAVPPAGFDPGVFAIHDFLTEEQEAEILREIELSAFLED